MNPKVSIHIPCYNRPKMLRECVESFLSQTFQDFEIIVIDDGSEEDISFVKDLDHRIRYYRQDNGGIAVALNNALSKNKGDYIMLFGSDDLASDKTLLEKEVAILDTGDYDIVYCDQWKLHKNGTMRRMKRPGTDNENNKFYLSMLHQSFIPHGGTMWVADKLLHHDESVSPADDWELFLGAIERGLRFYHIPERLWTYRVGHERLSTTEANDIGCRIILGRRGYLYDPKKRIGIKCN